MKRQTFNQFHTISTSIVHRSLSMRSFGLSQVNKIEKSKLVLRKHLFNTEIRYFSADVKNKTQKIDYGKTAGNEIQNFIHFQLQFQNCNVFICFASHGNVNAVPRMRS